MDKSTFTSNIKFSQNYKYQIRQINAPTNCMKKKHSKANPPFKEPDNISRLNECSS